MRRIVLLLALAICGIQTTAETLVADFDSLTEGFIAQIIQDGGITFSEADSYSSSYGFPPPNYFTVENASADSEFIGLLTAPNCLLVGTGYSPGPFGGWSRFGSAHISFEGIANHASINIFMITNPLTVIYGNQLAFHAFYNESLVAQDVFTVPKTFDEFQFEMVVSGILFDDLWLVASGPVADGAVLIAMDNVRVTLIPEPTTLCLLALGAFLAGRKKRT